jgi:hypothetical protein
MSMQSLVFKVPSLRDQTWWWGWSARQMSSQIIQHFLYALVLMHLVLLARFVIQISTSLSVLVPRIRVLYRDFYWIFSCYLDVTSSYYEM